MKVSCELWSQLKIVVPRISFECSRSNGRASLSDEVRGAIFLNQDKGKVDCGPRPVVVRNLGRETIFDFGLSHEGSSK